MKITTHWPRARLRPQLVVARQVHQGATGTPQSHTVGVRDEGAHHVPQLRGHGGEQQQGRTSRDVDGVGNIFLRVHNSIHRMDRVEIVTQVPPGLPAAAAQDLAKPGSAVVLYRNPQRLVLYHLPAKASQVRDTLTPVVRSLTAATAVTLPAHVSGSMVRVITQTLYLANAPGTTLKTRE